MTKNEKILYSVLATLKKEVTEIKTTEFYGLASRKLKYNITRVETTADTLLNALRRGKIVYSTENLREKDLCLLPDDKGKIFLGSDLAKITVKKISQAQEHFNLDNSVPELNLSGTGFPEYFKQFLIRFSQVGTFIIRSFDRITTLSPDERNIMSLLVGNIEKFNTFVSDELF